jgi:hypothetical protein
VVGLFWYRSHLEHKFGLPPTLRTKDAAVNLPLEAHINRSERVLVLKNCSK